MRQLQSDRTAEYYYTRDHLGSVREMTDSSGTIQARYDYDRTTLVSGTNLSDFQYAGYYAHQPSGLNLTLYRAYDPNTARWLSRDPLRDSEMRQGPNLYDYVMNQPLRFDDRLGLAVGDWWDPSTYGSSSFWKGAGDPNAWQQSAAATLDGMINTPVFALDPRNKYNQQASWGLGLSGTVLITSGVCFRAIGINPRIGPPLPPPPLKLLPPPPPAPPLPPNVIPGPWPGSGL